jgi:hypothetical protein
MHLSIHRTHLASCRRCSLVFGYHRQRGAEHLEAQRYHPEYFVPDRLYTFPLQCLDFTIV